MRPEAGLKSAALIPIIFGVTGCTAQATQLTEGEKLVQSTLALLTSDRSDICVDGKTRGDPLIIFRTMRGASDKARVPMRWHIPAPLRPPPLPTGRDVYDGEIGDETLLMREPTARPAALRPIEQGALNRAAGILSSAQDNRAIAIADAWRPGLVTARWWVLNRLKRDCEPNFTLSNPIWQGDTGFVSVMANHWGTTYALRKRQREWTVIGQLPVWVY